MKKTLLVLFLLFFSASLSMAQVEYYKERDEKKDEGKEEGPSFWDRTYFGGNFSLQFGDITFIDISPLMGYMLTEKLSAGVGATYQYTKYDFSRFKFETNTYGGRVFGRYNFFPEFFGHAEVESLSFEFIDQNDAITREWVPGVFLGGGYFASFGRSRGGFQIMGLYNLAYDEVKSPYNSPFIVRIGFTF